MARLAITDPDAPQPLLCPATGRVVVFNGADTSAEREWERFTGIARTRNDAELVLLRLAADGPQAMAPATGHHAGAVVDPRSAYGSTSPRRSWRVCWRSVSTRPSSAGTEV